MKIFILSVLLLSVLFVSCKKEEVFNETATTNVSAAVRSSEVLNLEITPSIGAKIILDAKKVLITRVVGELNFTVTVNPGNANAQTFTNVTNLIAVQVSNKLRLIKNFGQIDQVSYENKTNAVVTSTTSVLNAFINPGAISTTSSSSIIIDEAGGI